MPAGMSDSHAWAHTLLFSGSIIVAGIVVSFLRSRWGIPIIVLGIGAMTHQLVDPIMFHPQTLVWPLAGTHFPSSYTPLGQLQEALEQAVITVFLMLATSPLWRRRFTHFVTTGQLGIGAGGEQSGSKDLPDKYGVATPN